MIGLLMIADDFTGALDTGVHFSEAGGTVKVVTDVNFPLEQETEADVLVLDAETRHLDSRQAYEIVRRIAERACACGIPHIFKKTDSALRGNVGSELAALLEASGESMLPFIPAFPGMKRTTEKGIQYIEGQPVAESVFGKDPFEPVRHSYIPEILRETGCVNTRCFGEGEEPEEGFTGVAVFDAGTTEYLQCLAEHLYRTGHMKIMAGCAGLAEVLPKILGWQRPSEPVRIRKEPRFLIACGSVNPITRRQMDYAEARGIRRVRLTPEQKLQPDYWLGDKGRRELERLGNLFLDTPVGIIDSNDVEGSAATEEYVLEHRITSEELRLGITDSIGYLVKKLVEAEVADTLLIMGGDTLLGFLKQIGVSEMRPVCEVLPGTVLSEFVYRGKTCRILSKSGGFGQENLLMELADRMTEPAAPAAEVPELREG